MVDLFASTNFYSKSCGWYCLTNSVFYSLSSLLISATSSKVQAFEEGILDLQRCEPNMRAVVFTQFRDVMENVTALVERNHIPPYSFSGGTKSKRRDKAIRHFQPTANHGPSVFVITIGTGSVGITLTAASHVFLMEPCINPSDETQVAGRIHRLGQNKPVTGMRHVLFSFLEAITDASGSLIITKRTSFATNSSSSNPICV